MKKTVDAHSYLKICPIHSKYLYTLCSLFPLMCNIMFYLSVSFAYKLCKLKKRSVTRKEPLSFHSATFARYTQKDHSPAL